MTTIEQWNKSQKNEFTFWELQKYPIIDIYNDLYKFFINEINNIDKNNSIVLEVGCGAIAYSLLFGFNKLFLYDSLMDVYLRLHDEQTNMKNTNSIRMTGETEDIKFNTGTFDYIMCLNMLDHTRDMSKSFSEMCRVLKQGGKLLFSCDLRDTVDDCHPNIVTQQFIDQCISNNNLTLLSSTHTNHLEFKCFQSILIK